MLVLENKNFNFSLKTLTSYISFVPHKVSTSYKNFLKVFFKVYVIIFKNCPFKKRNIKATCICL